MSIIKRIDPRRQAKLTPAGLRRIVLGDTSPGDQHPSARATGHQAPPKPARQRQPSKQWFMAVVHADRGRLDEHARQVIAAAAILATPDTGVVAVILGDFSGSAASTGADCVVVVPDIDRSQYQPERAVAAVIALIRDYDPRHIFMPDNGDGDGDLGRRLIVTLSGTAATHVAELSDKHVAAFWSGGAQWATAGLPRFVLLEAGAADAQLPFTGVAEMIKHQPPETGLTQKAQCRDLGLHAVDAAHIALEEADFIVSGGNGVRNVDTLEALAHALGAAIGASRVAVDDGRFARNKQIGASGKSVSASTYIAVGISGAVQHLQGIKDCRHVIAINRDAGAPIIKRADLTVIGDAEDIMRALLTALGQTRNVTNKTEAT